ncbi:hypothetical protein SLE2022_198100 [Rubroshorea leprosula]
MDPVGLEPQDGLLFSNDRHYALHGEILLLVFVLAFIIFLALIILIPWLRRGRNRSSRPEASLSVPQRSSLRRQRIDYHDSATEQELQCRRQINDKFPL